MAPHRCASRCGLRFLNAWDAACLAADDRFNFISSPWQWATMIDDEKQASNLLRLAGAGPEGLGGAPGPLLCRAAGGASRRRRPVGAVFGVRAGKARTQGLPGSGLPGLDPWPPFSRCWLAATCLCRRWRLEASAPNCVGSPSPAPQPAAAPLLQVLVAERGPLVFVFNFSPFNDYESLQVRCCARAGRAWRAARGCCCIGSGRRRASPPCCLQVGACVAWRRPAAPPPCNAA